MEIQIERKLYEKIQHWVDHSNKEVSGLGKAIYCEESKVFTVTWVELYDEGTGASTDIPEKIMHEYEHETIRMPGYLFWWH